MQEAESKGVNKGIEQGYEKGYSQGLHEGLTQDKEGLIFNQNGIYKLRDQVLTPIHSA